MIFKTISGSIYELDQEEKRIRRLYGLQPAQKRQGKDEEWKNYEDIAPIGRTEATGPVVGMSLMIVWRYDIVDGESIARGTTTSLVKEIVEEKSLS